MIKNTKPETDELVIQHARLELKTVKRSIPILDEQEFKDQNKALIQTGIKDALVDPVFRSELLDCLKGLLKDVTETIKITHCDIKTEKVIHADITTEKVLAAEIVPIKVEQADIHKVKVIHAEIETQKVIHADVTNVPVRNVIGLDQLNLESYLIDLINKTFENATKDLVIEKPKFITKEVTDYIIKKVMKTVTLKRFVDEKGKKIDEEEIT